MQVFQRIIGAMHRAITDYKMIESGDKIAIGISGGKDSLCLAKALAIYKKFSKEKFEIVGIMIDMSNGKYNHTKIKDFCDSLGMELIIHKTDTFDIIFNQRKEKNPCSLCANMRRGALNSIAKQNGCNKVALAHHNDDMLETFLMSIIFEGRLSTFWPLTYLSNTNLTVIRPLIYVEEKTIKALADTLPVFKNPCPADHYTRREEMKNIIKIAEDKYPNFKKNFSQAITQTNRYNLLDKCKNQNKLS